MNALNVLVPRMLIGWCCMLCFASDVNGDWPEYRGNVQRNAYREQPLEARFWQPAWRLQNPSAPHPSWPSPARASIWQNLSYIEPRVIEDRADVPLIATDSDGRLHVLVASTSDDQLISLDPISGRTRWRFQTQAPIRFAPTIHRGAAIFGCDDGSVRSVDINRGELRWQQRIGPDLPWIVGNGRLVSPHPIRTSVVVNDGVVVAHAGLFPSQGVYSAGLDPSTGELVWRQRLERSPQGYLLATPNQRAYVPTGRSIPYAIDSSSGEILYDLPSTGGSFCMLTEQAFFSGPGNAPQVQSYSRDGKAKLLSFDGRQIAAGNGKIWTANGSRLACHRMDEVLKGAPDSLIWSTECASDQGLIVSGDSTRRFVFIAGSSRVRVFDANDGQPITELEIPDDRENIIYLAVSARSAAAPELLIASTESGGLYCWHGSSNDRAGSWTDVQRDGHVTGWEGSEVPVDIKPMIESLPSDAGYALVINDGTASMAEAILNSSRLKIAVVVENSDAAARLRDQFQTNGSYGQRVTVWELGADQPLPFSSGLFNLVVESESSGRSEEELLSMLWPGTGMLYAADGRATRKAVDDRAGHWRHQYANPANVADSGDRRVGQSAGFRLQWFGGVGPSRMPDRHLRGPSPLAAGSALVLQADGILIGVDPANGIERWSLELPRQSMRYVIPLDCGYACLSESGQELFVAANQEIWNVKACTGEITRRIPLPADSGNLRWGYLSEFDDGLFASIMKSTAPRVAIEGAVRRDYVAEDYKSQRALVCSRTIVRANQQGEIQWRYDAGGVIPNSSIAVDPSSQFIVFVEGRSDDCATHESDQVQLATLMQDAFLVCLDTRSGKPVWEVTLKWPQAQNVLHGQIAAGCVILSTSESVDEKAYYHLRKFALSDGAEVWRQQHAHIKGGLYHGEQVHHPVVLRRTDGSLVLVAEPYLYDLQSGERVVPDGADDDWGLSRPGHSCGTLSGAGDCLFFRANNPTVLILNSGGENFTKLAPSRPGCWINMIPACGQLMIPEASASCVCMYSLQTSMCFTPIAPEKVSQQIPILEDVHVEER